MPKMCPMCGGPMKEPHSSNLASWCAPWSGNPDEWMVNCPDEEFYVVYSPVIGAVWDYVPAGSGRWKKSNRRPAEFERR